MFKATSEGNSLCNLEKLDGTTDPVSLILDFCWIGVEWNKLVGVLDLYWCADTVAWLGRFHPLKETNKQKKTPL